MDPSSHDYAKGCRAAVAEVEAKTKKIQIKAR